MYYGKGAVMIKTNKGYCCEDISLIENYQLAVSDDLEVWDCHHRLELDPNYGDRKYLKEYNLYYDRPASELIFLKHSEHTKLHWQFNSENRCKNISKSKMGHETSPETRIKIGKSNKGKPAWNKGQTMSEEYCKKISLSSKNRRPRTEEEKKVTSEKLSNKLRERWQSSEYRAKISKSISEGVKRTYIEEHKRRISVANTGRKMSDEFKEGCRRRQLGKKFSLETRKKMSESQKRRQEEIRNGKGRTYTANL